ncbi:MAG TPA: prolyl oligopeptidase family serine peptidase [Pyrinomonadaceae bacterium]|nr:prolyl oligopeptidase family serine peptidase [Pyrinomonadaceae bacterium]
MIRVQRLALFVLLVLSAPVAFAQGSVKQYTIEQFMNTVRIGGSSFSADEKSILFHSNKSGIFNVYSVAVTGGQAAQLTNSTKESTFAVSYFPNDTRILYTYDRGGNENSHLYLRELNGTERDLTPGEKTKANFLGWSHDRKSFFFSTNERDPRFFDIYEMPIDTFKASMVYKDETGLDFGDISNDKKLIAFEKSGGSPADSDVYLYNVATKELKNITAHTGDVANSAQTFDVDSKSLYFLTDGGSEFRYVSRYNLATGKTEVVEKAPWDFSYTYFSRNGKYRVTAINEDARTKIKIYEQATGKLVDLPKLPNADITGVNISPSEKLMAFYLNGDRSPSNLYIYNFATKKATKLTDSLNPEINPGDLVDSQVIRYKSFDGVDVPSILYKPKNASAQNKVPALLLIHGGPGGQTRVGYSPVVQYLVNHGYVILGVNNRGSSGYGKTFFAADDGKHGREPLWDCVEAKKYLASLGYVDEKKIGIMGGSYGGYMVLAALAFKPEEFAVGVDLFGVSNWVRTLQSIPPYWESFRKSLYKEIGDPNTDLENLRAVSPLFHADKIVKPLIVLQGANDPRVIKPESDEIVDNIKKRNGVVEYVLFDNEGHGFTKKANEIRAYKAILDFVDRYLKTGFQNSQESTNN